MICRHSVISSKVMRPRTRHLRLPWIALAAIVGILWAASDASACSARRVSKSCCCSAPEGPATSGCCTMIGHGPDAATSSADRIPGAILTGIRPTFGTCACSPTSPANQGDRRGTRSSEECSSEVSLNSFHTGHLSHPSLAPAPATRTGPCPSHTPLYLRVEHLII